MYGRPRKPNAKTTLIQVRVEKELKNRLTDATKKFKITPSDFIRRCIETAIKKAEEQVAKRKQSVQVPQDKPQEDTDMVTK